MKLRILMVAVACLFSLSAFALPDYPFWTTYYDEEGCEVGYRTLNCAGQWSNSGTMTNIFMTEYGEPCHTEVELYTCEDFYLESFPGEGFPACYSEGYVFFHCMEHPLDCN